jgi:ribosomal protein L29
MKDIKYKDLVNLESAELSAELKEAELHMVKLRFDHAVNGNVPAVDLQNTRKMIAKYKTELRSREIATMTEEQVAKRSRIRERRRKN